MLKVYETESAPSHEMQMQDVWLTAENPSPSFFHNEEKKAADG